MEAMYGEPIRRRNEDLDPWIRFESWYMEGSIQGGICLNVRVGMDNIDAVDHGVELTLALDAVSRSGPDNRDVKRLAILGFGRKEALEASPGTYTNFATRFIAEAEAGRLLRKKAVVEAREAAEAVAVAEAEAAGVDPEWAAEGQEWRRRAAEAEAAGVAAEGQEWLRRGKRLW